MHMKVLFIILIIPLATMMAANTTTVEYYSGSKGSISIQALPVRVAYEITIKGKSQYKTLMAQVTKKKDQTRKYELSDIDNEFSWTLPGRDGKGTYDVIIYGLLPTGTSYRGLAHFSFTTTDDYPKELIDIAAERMSYYDAAKNRFRLVPPPLSTDSAIPLKGMNKYRTVMIQIAKAGKAPRQLKFTGTESTNFNWIYHVKEGPGLYTVSIFGNDKGGNDFIALCTFTITSKSNQDPKEIEYPINDKILSYALSVTNKTVGRGECWDLAAEALDFYNADWARPFSFGRPVDPKKEPVLPGDIIQMYSLKLVSTLPDGSIKTEYFGLPQHTAVVEKVPDTDIYIMLNQNIAGKRFVMRSILDLNHLISGRIEFYRPVAGLIKGKED